MVCAYSSPIGWKEERGKRKEERGKRKEERGKREREREQWKVKKETQRAKQQQQQQVRNMLHVSKLVSSFQKKIN